jgi:hypothetical protein
MVSAETDAAGLFFLFSLSALVAVTTVTTVVAVAKSSKFAGSFEPAFSILTKLSLLLNYSRFKYII